MPGVPRQVPMARGVHNTCAMNDDDVSTISDAALDAVNGGFDWTPKAIAKKLGYDWKDSLNNYTGTLEEKKAARNMAFAALKPFVDGSLKIARKLR